MTKITALAIATAAAGMISANADPLLSGNVVVSGLATLDTATVATATTVESWYTGVAVGSGDFSGITAAGSAFAAPWAFTTTSTSTALWTDNGISFYLTGVNVKHGVNGNNEADLTIAGTGYFAESGFANTPGVLTITSQDPDLNKADVQGIFSFSASGGTVPDGGTTVALLGSALIGLGGLRRMFRN